MRRLPRILGLLNYIKVEARTIKKAWEGRSGMADQLAGDHCQVLVVGAGPAGAATAYHLAKAGIDVLVLEKSAFPRDKICGDG